MARKFNKGEWSEFYTFIKILADKKIYLFDDNLDKLNDYYNVLKIFRKEETQVVYDLSENNIIKFIDNKKFIIESKKIKPFINELFQYLKNNKGASFTIEEIDDIFDLLKSDIIKGGNSYNKADIDLIINDNNVLEQKIGFNIKSYIGNPPTLLNSSKATNFIYEIIEFEGNIDSINNIKTKSKIRDRILQIIKENGVLKFDKIDNKIFVKNLKKIDTLLPDIIAIFLLNFFSGNGRKINEVFSSLSNNKLGISKEDFEYKIKAFLINIALGFVPTKEWDGYKKANGYIVVKNDGDIGCFNIFNEKILANYLFNNTKFDTPSSSRHDYGYIYEENGKLYIKLNLQIRF